MSFRAFLAVEVDPLTPLENLQRELEQTGADLNLVDPGNLHVTLKFLGDTPEDRVPGIVDAARSAVEGIAPRDLGVAGVGVFPNADYIRVVWAGFQEDDGDALTKVANRLEDPLAELGFEREDRKYHPHVTLARVQSGRSRERIVDVVESNRTRYMGDVPWERVVLMRSDLGPGGPTYSVVESVPLEG